MHHGGNRDAAGNRFESVFTSDFTDTPATRTTLEKSGETWAETYQTQNITDTLTIGLNRNNERTPRSLFYLKGNPVWRSYGELQ